MMMEEVAVANDAKPLSVAAASLSGGGGGSGSSFPAVFSNYPLTAAFLAFVIAQFLKVVTSWYKDKRWDARRLLGSGGMPSSHAASVTALAAAIGFYEGVRGSSFAIALVFACVVMYDASGVRLHAGRHAEILNQIVFELPAEHPLSEIRPLREPLGHTPPQVAAGAALGFVIAYLLYLITKTQTRL